MAIIKVFDVTGVKELKCFDTLLDVPYISEDEEVSAIEEPEAEK